MAFLDTTGLQHLWAQIINKLSDKVDKIDGKALSSNDYTTTEKNKLAGIASGAEVNQNTFSSVAVGATTIAADNKSDTLTIAAGDNITITPDATNDRITIAATNITYASCSTSAGTATKTATITAGTFTLATGVKVTVKFTYANTASYPTLNIGSTGAKYIYWHGSYLASSQYWEAGAVLDFVYNGSQWELIGIAKDNSGGSYTLSSFGITATSTELNTLDGITATVTELNYCDGVTSNIQTQLNGKAASSHGTHVSYGTSAQALGTSYAGSASTVSRSDHVHALPALTSCTGTLTIPKGGTGATSASGVVANLKTALVDLIYPVGAIYMSVDSTSPGTLFGGTWTQIKDTFLLSAGDTYTAGTTGGEATHTLTTSELPSHRHPTYNGDGWANFEIHRDGTGARTQVTTSSSSGKYTFTVTTSTDIQWPNNVSGYAGGGGAHNNMPPYLAVYVWERVS